MASAIESISVNDRTALAAVALCTNNGTTDWDEATRIAGSKSVHAMRERVRMARKRFEEQATATKGPVSPAAGVNKKAAAKVTPWTPKKATPSTPKRATASTPKSATASRKAGIAKNVKAEPEVDENDDGEEREDLF